MDSFLSLFDALLGVLAAVSGLRDELSQEIHISHFPTPGPSSPATPNLSHSAGSSQRPPVPYSSDVDTGDRLYDSASMTSDPTSAAGRRNSFRSDDESLSRAEQATVDNLVDKISGEYNVEILFSTMLRIWYHILCGNLAIFSVCLFFSGGEERNESICWAGYAFRYYHIGFEGDMPTCTYP